MKRTLLRVFGADFPQVSAAYSLLHPHILRHADTPVMRLQPCNARCKVVHLTFSGASGRRDVTDTLHGQCVPHMSQQPRACAQEVSPLIIVRTAIPRR